MEKNSYTFEVTLFYERETKNTYIFRHEINHDDDLVTRAIYVKKTAFPLGPPESITVTLKV